MLSGSIFLTGGTGSLGRAILRAAAEGDWPCTFTVYSRDEMKQQAVRREYPQHRYVVGDVADRATLSHALAGHETVIHAAAFKHIPSGEQNVGAMLRSNFDGSRNVIEAALQFGVRRVIAISTDKVCRPVNAYGASKMLMERLMQEAARISSRTTFHLVRYGNVLSSTGSVIPAWRESYARNKTIAVTSPDMTRFWMTVEQAVKLVLAGLKLPSATILIPKMPAMCMGDFARALFPDAQPVTIGLRPGEKMHEELLTDEESFYAEERGDYYCLHPVSGPMLTEHAPCAYSSDLPERFITAEELREMLQWEPSLSLA